MSRRKPTEQEIIEYLRAYRAAEGNALDILADVSDWDLTAGLWRDHAADLEDIYRLLRTNPLMAELHRLRDPLAFNDADLNLFLARVYMARLNKKLDSEAPVLRVRERVRERLGGYVESDAIEVLDFNPPMKLSYYPGPPKTFESSTRPPMPGESSPPLIRARYKYRDWKRELQSAVQQAYGGIGNATLYETREYSLPGIRQLLRPRISSREGIGVTKFVLWLGISPHQLEPSAPRLTYARGH